LIQAAVALYHASKGNRPGTEHMLAAGAEKMAGYPPSYLGLNTVDFWLDVTRTAHALLDGRSPTRPEIRLLPHPDRRPLR
jgi:hypothetical protein